MDQSSTISALARGMVHVRRALGADEVRPAGEKVEGVARLGQSCHRPIGIVEDLHQQVNACPRRNAAVYRFSWYLAGFNVQRHTLRWRSQVVILRRFIRPITARYMNAKEAKAYEAQGPETQD